VAAADYDGEAFSEDIFGLISGEQQGLVIVLGLAYSFFILWVIVVCME